MLGGERGVLGLIRRRIFALGSFTPCLSARLCTPGSIAVRSTRSTGRASRSPFSAARRSASAPRPPPAAAPPPPPPPWRAPPRSPRSRRARTFPQLRSQSSSESDIAERPGRAGRAGSGVVRRARPRPRARKRRNASSEWAACAGARTATCSGCPVGIFFTACRARHERHGPNRDDRGSSPWTSWTTSGARTRSPRTVRSRAGGLHRDARAPPSRTPLSLGASSSLSRAPAPPPRRHPPPPGSPLPRTRPRDEPGGAGRPREADRARSPHHRPVVTRDGTP